MNGPAVSVIIPAFNASKTIALTIDSVMAQTLLPLEILIVDDGSSDNTVTIAEAYPAPVKVVRKANGGPASARNLGARMAKGEWLAFLDSDDLWLPRKLERQMALAADPNIAIVHCPALDSNYHVPEYLDFDTLWRQNVIINSSVVMRRTVFEELGGFDEDRALISVEDYNMWLRTAAAGWQIRACQQRLVSYTRGIGLSSQLERFVKAQVLNVRAVGKKLNLGDDVVRERVAGVLKGAGRHALFNRDMQAARDFFRQASDAQESLGSRFGVAISHLPPAILNARRWMNNTLEDLLPRRRPLIDSVFIDSEDAELARRTGDRPILIVVVDAEEEFDWATVPSPSIRVESIKSQRHAQKIYARHKLVPTFAVDYAVASQEEGYRPLREMLESGECEIGTQLHPWINPPIEEDLTVHNSFPGNLPEPLQFEKLRILTDTIQQNFRCKPILYRAGRYGAGSATALHLKKLGYQIDSSVRPFYDMRSFGGPNYSRSPTQPFWCDADRTLLEIPLTVGMLGIGAKYGRSIYPAMSSPLAKQMYLPALLSRSNFLNRTTISPEGVPLAEAKELTRLLLQDHPNGVVMLSYHSTSLEPGNTPYVRTDADLANFLRWIEEYIEFFIGQCNGAVSTPGALFAELQAAPSQPADLRQPKVRSA